MRRFRRRYKKPKTPLDLRRIKEERKIINEYGLKRKKEIWIVESILRRFRERARELIAEKDKEKEKNLIEKLQKLGLLGKESALDDILALSVNDVLNRRLQTIAFKKGFGKTIKQARQLITHGHIAVDGRRIKFPGYLVPAKYENKISWYETSKMKGE
ncbi:MAG: 30S ribosomal protein S4 [Candidatus Aenigmatarchaeota archaeon]|nr:MAG: 30S ribosomal protein S4 [Candidatus Aenigmarchaeota archaeon]RLJ08945.1 MAG: 30S ribosomal protein S4 [Candidatus Aenigmarchaeota archaeon]RLJ09303.1 MAG: 30S ribosomal protein S4 [Candidatus Aenigmarchaeota archaeon]